MFPENFFTSVLKYYFARKSLIEKFSKKLDNYRLKISKNG